MEPKVLAAQEALATMISRLADALAARHAGGAALMLVGIQRRGADIARRLHVLLTARYGCDIPLGTLDINLYRDDWTSLEDKPHIGQSCIPVPVDGMTIVLVDDVLYTGRTIRAALEALLDYGRPKAVELLVLVDRGHRELPIQADYVGQSVSTTRQEQVNVLLRERDGQDTILLV
ncbi:MAG: bifunctional pyr operon transcriptional regulator/uracil phosphoribosyltransferase PyrR [Desulfovibrionaceae bacterium]